MIDQDAVFSPDRTYRYALWRIWDNKLPTVMFVGLNPSVANENQNDRTLNKCIEFAKSWGFGGLYMCNLFAYVHTQPKEMINVKDVDQIGPENDLTLKNMLEQLKK